MLPALIKTMKPSRSVKDTSVRAGSHLVGFFIGDNKMLKQEIWKAIKGFENYYEASNMGRIRGLDRYANRAKAKGGGKQICKGRILKYRVSTRYPRASVQLARNGKSKSYNVHSLVMKTFIGLPPTEQEINHKNCNALDNRLSNLEYCTHKENAIHAYKNGLIHPPVVIGQNWPNAKLTVKEVLEIRQLYKKTHPTYSLLAKKYNVTISSIHQIIKKLTWKDI